MMYERSGLHLFTFRGVDVFVSLWYMLLMAFFVFSPMAGGALLDNMVQGVMYALAVTLSLLVHEFGHAFVSKYYKLKPSIILHGFGGACMHRSASTDGRDAKILFAGPGAGLLFGGIAVAFKWFAMPYLPTSLALTSFVNGLVWVNIIWSLINLLLPIWPLDGGKLFHLALRRFMPERKARNTALRISIATMVLAGVAALAAWGFSLFIAIFGFFVIMQNVQMFQSGMPLVDRPAPKKRDDSPDEMQNELLVEAKEALERGDWKEAYRLSHQLRAAGGRLGEKVLDEIWTILSVASVNLEKYDEAESYLKRAPDSKAVQRARQKVQDGEGREA